MLKKFIVFVLVICALSQSGVCAPNEDHWAALKDRLVKDGFERPYLDTVFSENSLDYDPEIMARKMRTLLKRRFEPPAKRKPVRKSSTIDMSV